MAIKTIKKRSCHIDLDVKFNVSQTVGESVDQSVALQVKIFSNEIQIRDDD